MASPAKKSKYVKQVEWNKEEHYAFIASYAEALMAGFRKGKGLQPGGYDYVSQELAKKGIIVNEEKIRSHYDKTRYLYNAWKWMSEYTGCGYNEATQTYTSGNPDFWNIFRQVHIVTHFFSVKCFLAIPTLMSFCRRDTRRP